MACPCHTAALRTFVRAISQVHSSSAVAPKVLSQYQSLALAQSRKKPFSPLSSTASTSATRYTRRFHTASVAGEEAQASGDAAQVSEISSRPPTPVEEPSAVKPDHGDVVESANVAVGRATDASDGEPVKHVKKLKLKKKAQKAKVASEAAEMAKEGGDPPPAKKLKAGTKKMGRPNAKPTAKSLDAKNKMQVQAKHETEPREIDTEAEDWAATSETEELQASSKSTQTAWGVQKTALKAKFPEGWSPRKRLSPDALAGIRALNAQFPDDYTTEVLAAKFEVSPEAIRRILKSKWQPSPQEEESRQQRWFERGKRVWAQWAETGKKPPRRWRREGIVRKPFWNEQRTRSGRPRTKEEIAAVKFAKAQRLKNKISHSLL